MQLLVLSPRSPDLHAVIHLGDQVSELTLDGKSLATVVPPARGASDAGGIIRATLLDEAVTVRRRRKGDDLAGWAIRRLSDPVVVAGAMLLPDLAFERGTLVVPIVAIPSGDGSVAALLAASSIGEQRPVIALGHSETHDGVYGLASPDADALIRLLNAIVADYDIEATPQTMLWAELEETGWVSTARLAALFADNTLPIEIQRWLDDGLATMVPGFGMGRVGFLDEMSDRFVSGPADMSAVRGRIAAEIGDGPSADALTLHLLANHLIPQVHLVAEHAAAA